MRIKQGRTRGYRPYFRVLGASLGILGATCWMLWSRAQADPAAGSLLTLTGNRVYTLDEITRMLRERTRTEIYVDRRQEDRRIFISQGIYRAPDLIEALSRATGMMARQVKTAKFLAPRDLTLGGRAYFPVLPPEDLTLLGKNLRFLAEGAQLSENGVPFTPSDFLAPKNWTWSQMSSPQQTFLGKLMGGVKRNTKIRLGASYLMTVVAYTPAASPEEPNGIAFGATQQVYYDYRDRLLSGVNLPAR